MKNVKREFNLITKNKPLVAGENIPGFWCRINGNSAKIFFANPRSKKLTYPVSYGQSFQDKVISRKIIINFKNKSYPVTLNFEPYQSIMITINEKGKLTFDDIKFIPKIPEQKQ